MRACCGLAFVSVALGCTTTEVVRAPSEVSRLPPWFVVNADVVHDARMQQAAALLCARDTDAIIDDDVRHAAQITEGTVVGLLKTGADAQQQLQSDAQLLLPPLGVNVVGIASGVTRTNQPCVALVAATHLVDVTQPLRANVSVQTPQMLALHIAPDKRAVLYVLKPDGFVERLPVQSGTSTLTVPAVTDGAYALEIVVDSARDNAPSDPHVALLWPYAVGVSRLPPSPEVLFADAGHDDTALSHRAEALVQRLRNEQLIEPVKVSPPLVTIATLRAQALSQVGVLGHQVGGTDVQALLRERYASEPRAQFVRLAEVQAQASTLAEAWQALIDSPAHRYHLVDAGMTHGGVAVARGTDALGRPIVSLVAVLGRRPPSRDLAIVRAQLLERTSAVRTSRGLDPVTSSAHLDATAMRLAVRMMETDTIDETLLGGPIGDVALEADASLNRVRALIARTDDPQLLFAPDPPALLLEIDVDRLGIAVALSPQTGVFYVCVLAGE